MSANVLLGCYWRERQNVTFPVSLRVLGILFLRYGTVTNRLAVLLTNLDLDVQELPPVVRIIIFGFGSFETDVIQLRRPQGYISKVE